MACMDTDADVLGRILADRYSCRAFLDTPVPEDVIRRMLTMAQRTASWCNSQPWHVHLISGDRTRELGAALTAAMASGRMTSDIPGPAAYKGVYGDRRRASGYGLYNAIGIDRDDKAERSVQMLRNFDFFDAPHTAIITSDRDLGPYGGVDCGGYVTSLMLAARSLGVDTIAQAAIGMVAETVHAELGIGEDRDIVCAVSFGYADADHPANSFRAGRADIDDVVTWHRSSGA